jgi:hypothetical protein
MSADDRPKINSLRFRNVIVSRLCAVPTSAIFLVAQVHHAGAEPLGWPTTKREGIGRHSQPPILSQSGPCGDPRVDRSLLLLPPYCRKAV